MSRVPVHPNRPLTTFLATLAILALLSLPAGVLAKSYGAWGTATPIESLPGSDDEVNTASVDGCPIQSPNGLTLYFASDRAGYGGLDIWVAHRSSPDVGFGEPVNLGPTINSGADDFCPTPVRGKGLFFVSARTIAGVSCGAGDIYFARDNPAHGWSDPVNLGCQVNSAAGEAGPSYFETDAGAWLYFSSGPDIKASARLADGSFGSATPVAELNSTANDLRPNVRKGGLEIVFDSNRADDEAKGGFDLWFATRASTSDPWSRPFNGGSALNTGANETRGSFSWNGATLLFGRSPGPEGLTDIFISTRD